MPAIYGRQGIGKFLVKCAEEYILAKQIEINSKITHENDRIIHASMEMGVINVREDLFPWYESQGYIKGIEIHPNDAELTRIITPGMDVFCILMKKTLN